MDHSSILRSSLVVFLWLSHQNISVIRILLLHCLRLNLVSFEYQSMRRAEFEIRKKEHRSCDVTRTIKPASEWYIATHRYSSLRSLLRTTYHIPVFIVTLNRLVSLALVRAGQEGFKYPAPNVGQVARRTWFLRYTNHLEIIRH